MSGSRIYPDDTFNKHFFPLVTKVFVKTISGELIPITPMSEVDILNIKREKLLLRIREQMDNILRKHCQ